MPSSRSDPPRKAIQIAPRATTSSSTPTARPTSISARRPRPASPNTTGSRLSRARAGSPTSASTDRRSPISTRAGRCRTSSKRSEAHEPSEAGLSNSRIAYLQASVNDDLEMAYVAAVKDDVRELVSAAFAILAKYRQSSGWFCVSDEIAVAAIATAAFRTGELIAQVPPCRVRQVAGAASVPQRSIGNILGAGAILLVKSCIALLVALAATIAGILFAMMHAVMRHY